MVLCMIRAFGPEYSGSQGYASISLFLNVVFLCVDFVFNECNE